MTFGRLQSLRSLQEISISSPDAVPRNKMKDPGITFDSRHSRTLMTSISCHRVGILAGIFHVHHHVPDSVVRTLASEHVLSHIRYCLTVVQKQRMEETFEHYQLPYLRTWRIASLAGGVFFDRRRLDCVSYLREDAVLVPGMSTGGFR